MKDSFCHAATRACTPDTLERSRGRGIATQSGSSTLATAIEFNLALAIWVPPFIFGGREAIGQLTLAVLVLLASTLWLIRRIVQGPNSIPLRRPEVALLLAALALPLVTTIPLPFGMVAALSPGINRLLPAWAHATSGELGSDGWSYLSLAPGLSRAGALLFVLYVLLFWITLDIARTTRSARRLLSVLFATGIGVAVVGVLHYLFWNGKFYGLWELWWVEPDRHVRAPFTNRNHFAGFLALTIGPGIATLLGAIRRWKQTGSYAATAAAAWRRPHQVIVLLWGMGLTLILAAIVLSQSRGGAIVGVVAVAATALGLFRAGFSRVSGLVIMALIIVAGLGMALTFAREDPFRRTTAMLEPGQSVEDLSKERLRLWQADLHALQDFPLLGSGVGTHAYVYPLYLEKARRVTFTHAENGYVQVLVECGLAGGVLLALAIYCISRWCLGSLRIESQQRKHATAPVALAIGVSLLVATIHGAVDFVWYVPAYAGAMAVLAGLACSLYRNHESSSPEQRNRSMPAGAPSWAGKLAWGSGLVVVWIGLVGVVCFHFVNQTRSEFAWNAYFRLLPPADEKDSRSVDLGNLDQRAKLLAEACERGSADPDHHYRLGLVNLELFLESQRHRSSTFSLAEARAFLQAGKSTDPAKAQTWLHELYGDDLLWLRKAQASFRRSLQCCPLMGPAYVRLAELCFLDEALSAKRGPFCRQALLVRPHDPDVHLQVGLENWTAGDLPSARECWRAACRLQPSNQWTVLPLVAEQLPAAEAVDFIPLNFEGLRWLAQKESQMGRTQAARYVTAQAEKAVGTDRDRSKNPNAWLALHDLYRDARLGEKSEACLRKAVQVAPTKLGYHLHLIRWLMDQARQEEALEEAQRTRRCFPKNPEVQNLLSEILAMKAPPAESRAKRPGTVKALHLDSAPP